MQLSKASTFTSRQRLLDMYISVASVPVRLASKGKRYLQPVKKGALVEDDLIAYRSLWHLELPEFKEAYEAARQAAGWDFGILQRTYTLVELGKMAIRRFQGRGTIVELGTGRGWMMTALIQSVDWRNLECKMALFDTFEPHAVDPENGDRIDIINPLYAHNVGETRRVFEKHPRIRIQEGLLPHSIELAELDSDIIFLHIDLNHAESETGSLLEIWEKITPGAIIVWDDYGFMDRRQQRAAVDEVAHRLGIHVLASPTGQGICFGAKE
jgi:hypothetical protein